MPMRPPRDLLNVGNNPARGEFTEWSFFSPLYHQYRDP